MSKDKTTEHPIPADFLEWVRDEWLATELPDNNTSSEIYLAGCEATYRHLQSLPSFPVGVKEGKRRYISSIPERQDFEREVINALRDVIWNLKPGDPAAEERGFLSIAKWASERAWNMIDAAYEGAEEWKSAYENIKSKTERAGEISPVFEWVDINQAWPVDRRDVLIFGIDHVAVGWYSPEIKTFYNEVSGEYDQTITHWQYFPAFPSEEAPPTPAPEVKEEDKTKTRFRCCFPWSPRCETQCAECKEFIEPVKGTPVEQKVLHCQVYIEDGVLGCSTQCDHCREYYKLFSSPTERPAHVPDIKDILWDELAREYDDLNRMEENSWEWNRNILKQQYTIVRNTQGAVPDPKGEIPEDIMQWIIAHPDADYVSIPGKYIGFEPAYWRGVMTLYRTMKGKDKVLTEELAEIKLSFHQAVEEVKRLTTQLSGK